MHQFVTVHNVQHASETTGVLFDKVKIRSLVLAPLFNNSTDCGGAGRSCNFFFFSLLKQRQCRTQKKMVQPTVSLHSTGRICESDKCFICNPDKF